MTSYFNKYKRPFNKGYSISRLILSKVTFFLFAGAAALLVSCEEKGTTIGSGLLPGSDFVDIFSTDTIKPLSYTYYTDSVVTSGKTYSYLGGIQDPYFGFVSADFVVHLRIGKKWPGGGAFVVDSVKLYFAIDGAKGQLGTATKIKLSEVGELLYPDKDSLYYSNDAPVIAKELGEFDLTTISKDTIQSFMTVLPNSLGEYLMRDTNMLFQDDLESDFRSFFKGVKVSLIQGSTSSGKGSVTSSNAPVMLQIPFEEDNFMIRVYYKNKSASDKTYDFYVTDKSARYTLYSHDFSAADPVTKIHHLNDGVMDTVSYLQGFNGAYTRLRLPGLTSIKNMMPISVNRARLTVPVILDDNLYKTTTMPTRVYLSYTTKTGIKAIVSDYFVSSSYFGGAFDSSTKTYSFNIASFVQEYLEGKIDKPELEMYLNDGDYKNVMFKTKQSTSPAKFVFTYTEF